jgi:hypothetical protein
MIEASACIVQLLRVTKGRFRMKNTLVMLALAASSFAFADAPVSAQPQQKPQAPASQPAKAAPAKTEVKFVADKKEEELPQPAQTTVAQKAKLVLVADQKACASCPKTEKDAVAVESKDKAPAQTQTAAKTPAAPKIALA